MEVFHAQDDGARQWSRARDILDDLRKRRASLEMGHSQSILSHTPSSPTVTKLTTLHEYETCKTDRVREILDTMKSRREKFSKILIGVSSPASTKQSLTATESTAALSWVSSSSQSEPEIYSEEGASNDYEDYCYPEIYSEEGASNDYEGYFYPEIYSEEGASNDYEDYCYQSADDSTSGWSSSSSEVTYSYSEDSTYESANVLSALSREQSITEVLDVRNVIVPGNLTVISRKPVSSDQKDALERKTIHTSRSRSLYREGRSAVSAQETTNKRDQSHPFLKRERLWFATSRLDLAAITERRAMLANMLQSVSEQKDQEFDMVSTTLSVSTVSQSIVYKPSRILSAPSARRPPRPTPPKTTSDSQLPRAVYVLPSPRTETGKPFFGRRSKRDAQPESRIGLFGFPISELQWGYDSGASSFDSASAFNWEDALGGLLQDSESESMFYSDSRTGATDESPPLHILFKVKEIKSKQNVPPRPTRSADLKPVVRSIEDSYCGGLNQIAQLTDSFGELQWKWSSLNDRPRSPWSIAPDYLIPYNIEDRFCGGLYHIASLSSPPLPVG